LVATCVASLARLAGLGCSAFALDRQHKLREIMGFRSASRIGATCAITGSVLLFVGTYLHPMGADPNQAVAAFTEYAADHLWVASHLTQLAGVSLMVAALLLLAQQLRMGSGRAGAGVAAGGAIARLALAVALQAVDGMALKLMVY